MTDQHDTERPPAHTDVQFVGTPATLAALFGDLAGAQAAFKPIVKDSTASVQMKAGGSYKFDFAGLDVVIAATLPALNHCGLSVMQFPNGNDLVTVLAHKDGARIESRCMLPTWEGPQAFGSTVTYFRRYCWLSLVGAFPADEDSDGAEATPGNKTEITKRQPPTVQPAPQAAISQDARAAIGALAKQLGWKNSDLEGFSVDHGCGKLLELNDAKAAALTKLLQAAVEANK